MRDITNTPQLFIVRYHRNDTEDVGKQPTSKFSELYHVETDPASQLVAKYNGSNKIEQVSRLIDLLKFNSKLHDETSSPLLCRATHFSVKYSVQWFSFFQNSHIRMIPLLDSYARSLIKIIKIILML